jgi:glyoxylase-like metal-dependent hydrolase (beta-lactamase superfamily II)
MDDVARAELPFKLAGSRVERVDMAVAASEGTIRAVDAHGAQRRHTMHPFRRLIAGFAALLVGLSYATAIGAAAPQLKGQAPGYYRMMLGDFEIVALSDGVTSIEMGKLLTNTTPQRVEQLLKRSFLADPMDVSVNAYLVNTGTKLVMIDAGCGALFGPTMGKLVDNLKAAGYQPEQIDEIYITHMHVDHVGGLMSGDKIAFPNAIVRADQRDADYWLSPANLDAAPADMKDFFKGAKASLDPYIAAGKFKPFDGATELVPGVRSVPTYGHTKGHTIYVVESKGETLNVLGDLMHVAAVQFPDPSVTVQFDTDPKMAAVQRKKVYADTAKRRFWLAAAHLAFPGIGHIRADSQGYVFVPANYSIPRN